MKSMISDNFFKRLNTIAGFFAFGILFALAAFTSNLEIKDLDLWLHLRSGQYITQTNTIPTSDIFSCTIAGKPWNNHEWLFQVIIYWIKDSFGFDGLISMQSIIVAMTLLILLMTVYRRDRQWLAIFLLLLVLLVYQTRFTIRPDIFSLFFFSIYVMVLSRYLDRIWAIPLLCVVQLFWVNMHGFFMFGPILVFIGIISELIKRHVPLPYEWNGIGRLEPGELKKLVLLLMGVCATCLLNPGFVEGAIYPVKVLFSSTADSKVFFQYIFELQAPFRANDLGNFREYSHYKILLIISFFSFLFNRRRIDISALLIWMLFTAFSLIAIRNLIFFSAAAFLVTMVNAMQFVPEDILPIHFVAPRFKEITGVLGKIALMIWMINFGTAMSANGYFDFDTFERKSEYGGVSKRSFPYKAVDFLVENKIKGNFFNDFNSGAYLIGRASPNIKVFIDGRTEVYGGEFFKNYNKIWAKGDLVKFRDAEAKYKLTGAFLNNSNQRVSLKAIRMFYKLKEWKLVYFNYDGMIFLKDIPANREIIQRYHIDLKSWQPPTFDILRLGPRRVFLYQYIDRARMLIGVRLDKPALLELKEAIRINPESYELCPLLADIYVRQKQYLKAFEYFRLSILNGPNKRNRLGLAYCYERLGKIKEAIAQYQRVLDEYPSDAKIAAKIKKLKLLSN